MVPRSFVYTRACLTINHVYKIGLRKVKPYYFEYKSFAKGRWFGRTILDVFSSEFRDRSEDYYRYAIERELLTINNKPVTVDTLIKNGDVIGHKIHRHEPPCTDEAIKIVYEDDDLMVVDKPGGIPVHPAGRYRHNSIVHVLKKERNIAKLYPANRLDLPTSGLMLIAKNSARAQRIEREMSGGLIRKEYVCRVDGKFPDGEIICEAPIKCISHKMSVNYVHNDGKPSVTKFERLSYNGKTSVVRCKPLTGRTHQIRVHLRYLGYPISNDPLYGNGTSWSPWIRPGERMAEKDARMLVDKLFEYSPMEEWFDPENENPTTTAPKASNEDIILDDTRCSECSASLILGKNYDQLCIFLHAWRYAANGWEYETELPFWAKEDFNDDDAPAKYRNAFNENK
ncbi:pseudouridine synthase [Cokeromyces recurvatus]|uniref:pseudouridine synthase n=1 Tax=Cokeromyces recurvatus TaxID=90255 RepID=UPI00221E8966|nr:pseudouridine synthase [Cokeromyces recurvatus]KAI7905165.1 pseudouridine synthase [Cokeromyces recurvatus]